MNGLILTTSGAAEIEAAYQNGQTVTVRHVLLGDGAGGHCHPRRMKWQQ
ncbi:TPA: hypothetical protein IF077_003902 [Escherichia coli]|nr:hypothetical protein [Escherichia coli]HAN6637511.1 hypothetical protein [Escherichia coli]